MTIVAHHRQSRWVFVLGCLLVTAGVVSHLPMFAMARSMGYRLAGMPVDATMIAGMGMIVLGTLVAAWGLLPPSVPQTQGEDIELSAPEDAPLGAAHWALMASLVVALAIDVMKPASLGFTIPGMVAEYGVSTAKVSLVPFSALTGTVVGSILWGVLADIYGRKATILLSSVMFVGTSICGAMPSLAWNIAMCFMMGAAAGGMLPVAYALLAEMMPTRHRGWSLVLVGGLGAVGGYLAASAISAYVQPEFGWRILWLANLPTGLALALLGRALPESAKFLLARGRVSEAQTVAKRFGAVVRRVDENSVPVPQVEAHPGWTLAALSIAALAWGLVNFGLLLWLPADLVAKGQDVAAVSGMIAKSALIGLPTAFIAALLYSRWSTKWSLALMVVVLGLGVLAVAGMEAGRWDPVVPVMLLVVGANGLLAILLPYAAECFPLRTRGRATGWVAACTKAGGLVAASFSLLIGLPRLGTFALALMVPLVAALAMIAVFGRETRGRALVS